jgi:WXG100 family type VII secretion target
MAQIKATPEELRNHATSVNSQAEATRSNFSELRGKLDQLHGQFEGAAAQAFDAKFNEWHASGQRLIDALNDLGGWLNKSAETIEQTDQQLAQGLS